MLSTKMRNSVFCNKPNLTNVILTNNFHRSKHYFYKYGFIVREISTSGLYKDIQHVKYKMKLLLETDVVLRCLKDTLINIPRTLKQQSTGILRIWAHQCECVLAQRLRRGQQMFCLYSRLWEEHALRELLLRMHHQISRHSKEIMLSACGITAYNWDSNRITDKEIKSHMTELDYIQILRQKTLYCDICKKRECSITNKDCCVCPKPDQTRIFDKWMPFVEKKDIMVWRRLHNSGSGHYEYKVYGSFSDVTAEDFLNVQIDSEYRKKWDKTAIMLEVVEADPNIATNSEVIYWEMRWPKLFVNRDYVFNRRFLVDENNNTVIIVSRGTKHPACPVRTDKYRVDDYWSEMVIKSYTDLDKPGIEFGLTYFDNPGINIPATVTTWVAMREMPDFLMQLRTASVQYKSYCEKNGKQFIFRCGRNIPKCQNERSDEGNSILREMEEVIIDNTIFEAQHPIRGSIFHSPSSQSRLRDFNTKNHETETNDKERKTADLDDTTNSPTSVIKSEMTSQDFWKYLKPHYYFS